MENVYNVYLFHSIQIYQLHYLQLANKSFLFIFCFTRLTADGGAITFIPFELEYLTKVNVSSLCCDKS